TVLWAHHADVGDEVVATASACHDRGDGTQPVWIGTGANHGHRCGVLSAAFYRDVGVRLVRGSHPVGRPERGTFQEQESAVAEAGAVGKPGFVQFGAQIVVV